MILSIEERKKLMSLATKIEEIEEQILLSNNNSETKNLQNQKQLILYEIEEMHLQRRLKEESLNDGLINDFAALGTKRSLLNKTNIELNDNKYNLSSEFINSNRTGKTMGVKYMGISEKISTIYEHTGEIVSYHDPVLVNSRDNLCASFIEYLENSTDKNKLVEKYGDNWKEEVARRYKQGYDSYMQYHINKTIEEVDSKYKSDTITNKNEKEKNTETFDSISDKNKKLTAELSVANKEISRLTNENTSLKNEISVLNEQLQKMQQSHKEDMETLKNNIVAINNQNNTNEISEVPMEEISHSKR